MSEDKSFEGESNQEPKSFKSPSPLSPPSDGELDDSPSKKQSNLDDTIKVFDYEPIIGSFVYARVSKVYYLCEIISFTDKEVLVRWQIEGCIILWNSY